MTTEKILSLQKLPFHERGDVVKNSKDSTLWLVWNVNHDGSYCLVQPGKTLLDAWYAIRCVDIQNLVKISGRKKAKKKPASLPPKKPSFTPLTPEEARKQIDEKFNDDHPDEPISGSELKTLHGAMREMKWPSGASLSGEDAKKIIYHKYDINSLKHLARKEFHEVMDALGHVAAGRFQFKMNTEGYPYIAHTPHGATK